MKSFVFENKKFRLTVGENAMAESLIYKENGEELVKAGEEISFHMASGGGFIVHFTK